MNRSPYKIAKDKLACKTWYIKYRENKKAYRIQYYRTLKYSVLSHYSNGIPKCICCGEIQPEFLEIDHILGGGCKHRKQIIKEGGAKNFYHWLIQHSYPPGYRVLCANCNKAYGNFGYCPHKEKRDESWPASKEEDTTQ